MAAIGGTVAAVAGMMWATIWVILKPHVGGLTWKGMTRNLQVVLIAGGAFVASWIFGVHSAAHHPGRHADRIPVEGR